MTELSEQDKAMLVLTVMDKMGASVRDARATLELGDGDANEAVHILKTPFFARLPSPLAIRAKLHELEKRIAALEEQER